MKPFLCLGFLILVSGCARNSTIIEEQQLQSLLEQKEYFRLRTSHALWGNEISWERNLYFRAFVENAFNQNDQSEKDIDSLLANYPSGLDDSSKTDLLRLQSNSYFRTFAYAKAAATDKELLDHYSHILDSFNLYIGNKKITLKKVSVLIDPIAHVSEKFYGNICQDLILQSKELILNFKDMYIYIK